jgi:NitT/TauT family transport system substrate-binding protein
MKHAFFRTAAPAIGLAMLGALSFTPAIAQDLTKVTVRLAWIAGGVDAPFFVADANGYFAEEGLDVEVTDGSGSTASIQAAGSGDFDIVLAGLGVLAQARQASGADNLVAVAGLLQKDPTSIISLEGSGIKTPKDIEGKRLGTDAGNLEDGMIKAFADANGVDFSKVEVIVINGGNDRVALLKGDVDFINGWANPDGDKVAAEKPIEPPLLFADYGVNILGTSVITRKDWLAENGDTMKAFLRALLKGKAAADADPAKTLEIFMSARPDSDAAIIENDLKVMGKYEHTAATEGKAYGVLAEEDVALTISLLEKYSGMAPGLTPADIYDASYLPTE